MTSSANIANLVEASARRHGDTPAVIVADRPSCTYRELADRVARRAAGLRAAGLSPGRRIAFYAGNSAEYLEFMLAGWHAGGVVVPLSRRLHPIEAGELVRAAGAVTCVADADGARDLESAGLDDCPVVTIGAGAQPLPPGSGSMASIRRSAQDDAWIFFTSGTTGQPKGARLSHGNLQAMAAAFLVDVSSVAPGDHLVHVAALSHASGLFALPYLARGGSQVLPDSDGFDAAELVRLLEVGRRATFFVPPVLLRRLCLSGRVTAVAAGNTGTVLVGAAPVTPSDLRLGLSTFGARVWNGYGQGESPCTITAMAPAEVARFAADDGRLASVGVPRYATRVRVVDSHDREVPAGHVGEIVVDGPTVMSGYLDRGTATAETMRGGWLHTGDLGTFDPDGYLTLLDRAKDLIITGGDNVYPRQIEDLLLADPAVQDAAVVGVPDAEWGERVVAFVVPAAGTRLDLAALDARCLSRLARFKRPRQYKLVQRLPRNSNGKVVKSELRDSIPAIDLVP